MTYQDQTANANDPIFRSRVEAAIVKESRAKSDELATTTLKSPATGLTMFLPFIVSEPGFDLPDPSVITDGQLLSATQAVWPSVAAVNFPPDAP